MRTLCDVCEAAAARVFCAADEAALCPKCDEKVHGCNKLASRHVRLTLAEARAVPHCDICENAPAFFFCGVDGTSLCLQCDLNVHVGGKKTHERYLLMGQRVELPMLKLEDEFGRQPIRENQRLEASDPHKQLQIHSLTSLLETKQENKESSNTSAIAVAVGDTDTLPLAHHFLSQMTDLNSRPQSMQGERSGASQSVRDSEWANSSDEETPGAAPDRLSRGKRPADS